MRWPRLTMRTLMVAVAMLAGGLWIARLADFSRECRENARRCAAEEARQRANAAEESGVEGPMSRRPAYLARARYFAAKRLQYERAARYPWLPLGPDPPAPD